jgi:tetratricopeptide (TPR) repeat protein
MTGLGRIPRIGKVLVAGALIGLAGCQQVPSRPGTSSPLGWGNSSKGGEPTITPAQEADVQISMGRAAEQQGNLEQAMFAYRAAVERDQRRADAYARMAVLNDKQGKFRESAELYRKALAVQPGDPDIFCDMGYSFYLQRRWAEAEMNLRQSIAINPDHQRAHNNLALLLVRDNRLDAALAEFRKAGSDPVQAHMNLAFALTIDQRWESARTEYERALAIDPSCELAKVRRDQLKTLVAKRESPDGARRDPAPVTTATPPALRGPASPIAAPEQSIQSAARRDPALITTAAMSSSSAQRYRPKTRVAIPSLAAENGAMGRLWSTVDAPPRPPAPAAAPTAPPERREDAHAQRDAAQPDDSSSVPMLAIASPRPAAPPVTRRGGRRPVPPPRPFAKPGPVAVDPTPKSTSGP